MDSLPVYGVAIPTVRGLRNVLDVLGAANGETGPSADEVLVNDMHCNSSAVVPHVYCFQHVSRCRSWLASAKEHTAHAWLLYVY